MSLAEWTGVGMWTVVVLVSAASLFKLSRLKPGKSSFAKQARVVDAFIIVLSIGYAGATISTGEMAGWVVGALMCVTIVLCVVEVFVINRYLDRGGSS